jgi:K+-sensing histidine kinase KdpD
MEIPDRKTPRPLDASKIKMDDIIDDLFHDAQNSIHRVGMELELVSMGLGKGSDAAKTAEMIKLLDNNVRDLRGYISSVQEPSATCDPAAVLQSVVANLQFGHRSRRVHVSWIPPQSLPLVAVHRKLLARVLERVLDFCENLMQQGGELRITAGRQENSGQFRVEIILTMLAAAPIDIDKELFGEPSAHVPIGLGAKRALEVLRRHHGEISFHRDGVCQCAITLRMLASPQ